MDHKITSSVLQYLLDNSFSSKAEMAREFDMDERYLQRLIKHAEHTKGGTIALQKALSYCVKNRIPVGSILDALMDAEDTPAVSERAAHGRLAYTNLRVMRPGARGRPSRPGSAGTGWRRSPGRWCAAAR